jgi:hypothetical protein
VVGGRQVHGLGTNAVVDPPRTVDGRTTATGPEAAVAGCVLFVFSKGLTCESAAMPGTRARGLGQNPARRPKVIGLSGSVSDQPFQIRQEHENVNTSEREAIGVCIACEAIGDLVNHALLDVRVNSSDGQQGIAYFRSRAHRDLFLIRLLDFAKESGDSALTGVKGSCLEVLRAACVTQSFGTHGSAQLLQRAVQDLDTWLKAPSNLNLWLPTIDVEVEVKVPRLQLLFISGNQAKHNISRLTGLAHNVQDMLRDHGHDVPLEQIPLALEDFTDHLDEHFFVYYGTWISELLNEVRWGIQFYLGGAFARSFTPTPEIHEIAYRYSYPEGVQNPVARSWYWRLMNHVRSGPSVNRFRTPKSFKLDRV